MKKLVALLLMLTLVISSIPMATAATPAKNTFKSVNEIYGFKSFGIEEFVEFVNITEKNTIFYHREKDAIAKSDLNFTVSGKTTLSKDKKKVTYKLASSDTDLVYTFTKDAKGKMMIAFAYDGEKNSKPIYLTSYNNEKDMITSSKKNNHIIEGYKEEMRQLKQEQDAEIAKKELLESQVTAENVLFDSYIFGDTVFQMHSNSVYFKSASEDIEINMPLETYKPEKDSKVTVATFTGEIKDNIRGTEYKGNLIVTTNTKSKITSVKLINADGVETILSSDILLQNIM